MRRAALPETETKAKRPRCSPDASDDLFHNSRKRSTQDLSHLTDDSGYVEGRVFMTWPLSNGVRRLNLEVSEGSSIKRFEVVLSGCLFHGREGLSFRPHDRICLALKSAKVESRKESSAPYLLPLTLKYTAGVVVKYLSGVNSGKVINTWEDLTSTEDWYNPVPSPQASDAITNDVSAPAISSPSTTEDVGKTNHTLREAGSSRSDHQVTHDACSFEHGDRHIGQRRLPKPQKKRRKRRARETLVFSATDGNQQEIISAKSNQHGDDRISREQQISEFNGQLRAIGYTDKLRWAVYDPARNNARLIDRGNAPEGESTDGGVGYFYTPFWKPSDEGAELKYCKQLSTWRDELQESGRDVTRVQCPTRATKEHRLLSEVSPEIEPGGFFNCTVEILQTFQNDCGSYTATGFHDRIMRIEMWDAAREMAQLMSPGEYWYIYNIQARWNGCGYVECKMWTADKVHQLEESETDKYPHLEALLGRKKNFAGSGGTEAHLPDTFPCTLLQDVDEESALFSCVVEILFVDHDSRDGVSVYATDYTFNPNLPERAFDAKWARGLDHRVLRVKLDDAQARTVNDIVAGSFYKILNLRLIRRRDSSSSHARLGGEERLIHPLHEVDHEQYATLKTNKDQWKRELELDGVSQTPEPGLAQNASVDQLRTLPRAVDSTIEEALSSPTCPSKFTVVARTVDFFPFDLQDASVLRCMNCETDIETNFKACPRVKDETGSEIIISLSEPECTVLQGVHPDDFRSNREAYGNFLARLKPVIGNLTQVHEAWNMQRDKEVVSPRMRFTIESWKVDDERGYTLIGCTPV
ncbi:hypothetical protein ID866_2773 [Astraeus odoratus]|nr:hypothetical protein ID866_2773 [Astraeus odoratus]